MVVLNNIADNFFRSIRSIKFFRSSEYSFEDNLSGVFPTCEPVVCIRNIIPEDYEQSIKKKKRDGNYYYDIELSISIHVTNNEVESLKNLLDKKNFTIVLESNADKTVLGNEREPLLVELLDLRKNDNSGKDQYSISITGSTIIPPVVRPL